ncbi:MAG TPA: IS110 family transposase [Bryobacteraceae bacterium]|nr:IS110 family transposase [Bryobacteraceae bacterium]
MKILYRRCAALDVHKKTVCACIRQIEGKADVQIERSTFGTYTDDLERLGEWLQEHKVKRVAMESTGVYWIPVWNVLEQNRFRLELLLVNPALVKALPGQKTDPKDAGRIAELHQYGLLRGSFIPPKPIRQLRDLVRSRVHIQQDRNRIINRIARLLESANVKLGSVASNIVGKSGRRMLYAIAEGQREPAHLAGLALGQLQKKEGELARALQGRFTDHLRFLLQDLLEDLHHAETRVEQFDRAIRSRLLPHAEAIQRLRTIPGVDEVTAWAIVSEIGFDMSVFPTADHLASWAGLCPGNDESAGKRRSGRTRKGDRYLRRTLVQNAWAVAHAKDSFLTSLFLRIARRRGMKKAALAVAHRILVVAYHILREGVVYRELGSDYHDRLHPLRTTRRLVERLDRLGFQVDLRPKPVTPKPEMVPDTVPRGPGRPRGPATRPYPKRFQRTCPRCAEHGIMCIHSPAASRHPSTATCPRCARWGIPCIHLKPRSAGIPQQDQ